ncbi:MAG: hypothetical protein Q3986_05050 [Akkermansia sp.]|nr:hypothetical protein [Akkermansia sp.]
MKAKHYITAVLAAATLLVPSCTSMSDYDKISFEDLGGVHETMDGTVVAARYVKADASNETKAWSTALGTAVGAGAGQLLGGGSGRVASTVGFGVVGALAGRGIAEGFGTHAQELTVKVGNGRKYTVTQPIYKQFGAIPVGTRGTLHVGNGRSRFVPN